MKHIDKPIEVVWYYVTTCGHYFPYVEHRPNGIMLDARHVCGRFVVAPYGTCHKVPYEEVRAFYGWPE
jgi:hypothetical protein